MICRRGPRARLGALVALLLLPHGAAFAADAPPLPAVDCVIRPSELVELGSPVAGVIEEILVDRSDPVQRGQVVARLDARIERETLELARARTELDPQLRIAEIDVDFDARRRERIDALYDRRAIPV